MYKWKRGYVCVSIGTKTVSSECLDGDCGTVEALRLFSEMECRKKTGEILI